MHDSDHQPPESDRDRDIRLSTDAMGQLDDQQRQQLESDLHADAELSSQHGDLVRIADALSRQHAAEVLPTPSLELRDAIQARLDGEVRLPDRPAKPADEKAGRSRRRAVGALAVTACLLVVLLAVPVGQAWRERQSATLRNVARKEAVLAEINGPVKQDFFDRGVSESVVIPHEQSNVHGRSVGTNGVVRVTGVATSEAEVSEAIRRASESVATDGATLAVVPYPTGKVESVQLREIPAAPPGTKSLGYGAAAQSAGGYPSGGPAGANVASGSQPPDSMSESKFPKLHASGTLPVAPTPYGEATGGSSPALGNALQFGLADGSTAYASGSPLSVAKGDRGGSPRSPKDAFGRDFDRQRPDGWYRHPDRFYEAPQPPTTREQYEAIVENPFVPVSQQPLSTLSIDVDTASYANVRRFLLKNQLPPANAVRIEELINYFSYDYPAPANDQPFASHLEVTECPWQPKHRLVRVGLQGKTIEREERPGCNLVFLLDVSGSMKDVNKLPLLKQAMKLLVDQLDENDRVAIVTYASQAGVRLKSTVADKHDVIREAINGLNANGSTNGGAGIQLAYEQALAGAIEGGVNRVILATDGDLNVGITDDDALVRLIKEKADSDVFLTVLGFGEGNLQDAKLEKLADNGNGLYAYIDNLREARKVLVEQIEGSLVTIAKDVKIKVEFNPAEVLAYRLIGYENRLMTAAEFDDDKKDAGEIGAGHSVTALYEIVPAAPAQLAAAKTLKYQQPAAPVVPQEQLTDAAKSGELLTLSLRYKLPDSDESTLVEVPLLNARKRFSESSLDFRFATAVASFGMLLRDSVHRGDTSFAAVEEIASAAIGDDEKGYRTEFLDLVRRAASLK